MRSLMPVLRMRAFVAQRAARGTAGGPHPPRPPWLDDPEAEPTVEGILAFCEQFFAEVEGERLVHELLVP